MFGNISFEAWILKRKLKEDFLPLKKKHCVQIKLYSVPTFVLSIEVIHFYIFVFAHFYKACQISEVGCRLNSKYKLLTHCGRVGMWDILLSNVLLAASLSHSCSFSRLLPFFFFFFASNTQTGLMKHVSIPVACGMYKS